MLQAQLNPAPKVRKNRFKYMELARVYDLGAANRLHLQSFQI
jgi:hypothetical protein